MIIKEIKYGKEMEMYPAMYCLCLGCKKRGAVDAFFWTQKDENPLCADSS